MRYIPIAKLEEGMQLGQNMYNTSNQLILSKQAMLTEGIINLFNKQGYQGVYIDDEISKDIDIEDVVSIEIREKAKNTIKSLFDSRNGIADNSKKQLKNDIDDILVSILENKNVIINMVDLKTHDNYTYSHSVNVAILSGVIGSAIGMNRKELEHLITAAMLHDIGKKFVPLEILNKKDKLTDEEFSIIKNHSDLGYHFLKDHMELSAHVYTGILLHHEKYNGRGYPFGKKGAEIPLISRIICVSDVYDALTSNRPYHNAYAASEGMEYIMGASGEEFDPDIVSVFIQKVALYPVGTEILLSNNEKAMVLKNYESFGNRPLVKLLSNNALINLKDDRKFMNVTVLKAI